ncbi:UDP-N-acetylmuramate:L-alanyl-gamma-D-glutamyl-meso-diaminopimelate ligase [Oceanospirillum sediminis]|uniref:UDP-N-acetylmuramate--L-alanyl-gamma-D-glutamyl-meso-2,6-diaminoheptandioate ligase n=1 Tax=Oceanospirillum sediminis TaxID=2760088 RepID=A0A839IKX0_9GAMM|nr:UDP-N-acetylmuramate:L-alanyl-gamma-D-glutamyl-meso-diaminopimelate ligase [Oceanospirillum sediminis]MBB1485521.1 UDP-N-acetylmuramate:L-alanyl-gamma-D-glutamyl-meso-diaminopimelate ligase [Oceanospirillum sediminis]
MHLHILGICGTFMGSLALLARELGHKVTGCDANVYPPMSTQLQEQGIDVTEGFDPAQLDPAPDLVIIGNAMSRGNPAVEYVLNKGLAYTSGPQWLSDHVLPGRWVMAIAGTHGKTTTTSMLGWILEYAHMSPGFLVGGVPENFGVSARLGDTPFFVIEADEYDSAFFDKRSKFVHYQPRTLVMNNLEFDHADIFPDLAAIQRQFHHLVRTVPGEGLIIHQNTASLNQVLDMGCWTECQNIDDNEGGHWQAQMIRSDGSEFSVLYRGDVVAELKWALSGQHNVANALAAIAAARHVGVTPEIAAEALAEFRNVKRRMELKGEVRGIRVYDDFAHHPTAIYTTLEGARNQLELEKDTGNEPLGRLIAVIEPRSNTMRLGTLQDQLAQSTRCADQVFWYQPKGLDWNLEQVVGDSPVPAQVESDLGQLIDALVENSKPGDRIVVMSNGGFGGIHQKLLDALNS